MSGVDRGRIGGELEALGWQEDEEGNYIPPQSLWDNKPTSFYVYEAADLQELLGKSIDEE